MTKEHGAYLEMRLDYTNIIYSSSHIYTKQMFRFADQDKTYRIKYDIIIYYKRMRQVSKLYGNINEITLSRTERPFQICAVDKTLEHYEIDV